MMVPPHLPQSSRCHQPPNGASSASLNQACTQLSKGSEPCRGSKDRVFLPAAGGPSAPQSLRGRHGLWRLWEEAAAGVCQHPSLGLAWPLSYWDISLVTCSSSLACFVQHRLLRPIVRVGGCGEGAQGWGPRGHPSPSHASYTPDICQGQRLSCVFDTFLPNLNLQVTSEQGTLVPTPGPVTLSLPLSPLCPLLALR